MGEKKKEKNKLAQLLDKRMTAEGLSVRDAGQLIGISHATVARVVNGETVKIETLKKICEFLGVSPDYILGSNDNNDELMSQIQTVISIEPELAYVLSEISVGLSVGTVPPRILSEIAAFAKFRLVESLKKPTS